MLKIIVSVLILLLFTNCSRVQPAPIKMPLLRPIKVTIPKPNRLKVDFVVDVNGSITLDSKVFKVIIKKLGDKNRLIYRLDKSITYLNSQIRDYNILRIDYENSFSSGTQTK